MTQVSLAKIIADFETSLATKIDVGGTTATLQAYTDDDGVALPTGRYFFTIDGNNSSKEHIAATLGASGALTAIKTVSRQGTETSGVVRSHRVGAKVVITDFAHIKKINDLLDGTTNFDPSVVLGYSGTASISSANQFATKDYVDGVTQAGASDASVTVKGIARLSTGPVSATGPIVVGDNDPRLPTSAQVGYIPTSGQKDALVGDNTDIAVGTGNKFVTQTGLQKSSEVFASDTATADAYVITLSPAPSSYATGMVIRFKASTINTATASINVNGLGAKTLVKKYNVDLANGDIKANQIVEAIYDGTNFQLLSPVSNTIIYSNGLTSHSGETVSGTQNIPHGLGITPTKVKILARTASGSFSVASHGVYDSSGQNCIYYYNSTVNGSSSAAVVIASGNTSDYYVNTGLVSVDSTNISIAWTRATGGIGGGTQSWDLMWEASA